MNSEQVKSIDNFEKMEENGRTELIKVLRVIMIVCFLLESAFAVYFIIKDDLILTVPQYIFRRVIIPTAVNIVAYITATSVNKSDKSAKFKNYVISFSMIAMSGVVSIFHSFFIPIWGISVLSVFFSTIFHDRTLHFISLIMAMVWAFAAFTSHLFDYPDDFSSSLQTIFVVLAIVTLSGVISRIMLEYNTKLFSTSVNLSEDEFRYRSGFERDALTKVSSRAILEERASDMLSRASVINPVCIAIIDIDNFKHVNDTYGHDNGDIVLKSLGEIILSIESKHVVVGRFGGEEFVFVFENGITDPNMDAIDELRRSFSTVEYDFMNERLTFSGGFYVLEENVDYEEAVSRADKALYKSKRNGKNKITKYVSEAE